jgi:hypothetical protein
MSLVHGFQIFLQTCPPDVSSYGGGEEALLEVSRWEIGCLAGNISISMETAAQR